MNVSSSHSTIRRTSAGLRHDAEADEAERGDRADHGDQHEPDDREAGHELAVHDVVAVDRLRQEPRQRPLRALAVDRVERERQPEQRRDVGQEPGHRRQGELAADVGASQNSAMKIAWASVTLDATSRIAAAAKYSGMAAARPSTTTRTRTGPTAGGRRTPSPPTTVQPERGTERVGQRARRSRLAPRSRGSVGRQRRSRSAGARCVVHGRHAVVRSPSPARRAAPAGHTARR